MRNRVATAAIVLLAVSIACAVNSSREPGTEANEANKAVVRAYLERW